MEWLADPNAWIALATLTALEIVLGVDNIIFISILCGRLPEHQRARARTIGLVFAMLTRIGLLFTLTWLMTLTAPLFSLFSHELSGRDLILIAGGLFLIWKSVHEIHNSLEGPAGDGANPAVAVATTFAAVIAADRSDRHRVFTRFGNHRSGHGRRTVDHGDRDCHCSGCHAVFRRLRSATLLTVIRRSRCLRCRSCCLWVSR